LCVFGVRCLFHDTKGLTYLLDFVIALLESFWLLPDEFRLALAAMELAEDRIAQMQDNYEVKMVIQVLWDRQDLLNDFLNGNYHC